MDELIKEFSLDHCSKKGAKFDFEKGKWFNHEYLMNMPSSELATLFRDELKKHIANSDEFNDAFVERAVELVKGRANFVQDLWDNAGFFFAAPQTYNPKDIKKRWTEGMPDIMRELINVLNSLENSTSAYAEQIVLGWIEEKGYHKGNVMNAFRLCVVGVCKGPHMFDIVELLGIDEVVSRIERGIKNIKPIEQ